jgi:hypothetical protein
VPNKAEAATDERTGKIAAGAIFLNLFSAIMAFIGGWWLMLTIGIAHHEWTNQIPAIGYGTAVKITAMLGLGPGIHRLHVHYTK